MTSKRIIEPLPPIPPKRYFTIGETSRLCAVEPHVLRYWEQQFNQIRPMKRSGRRYYQHKDVGAIRKVRELLYGQGFTISGAKKKLGNELRSVNGVSSVPSNLIHKTIGELEGVLELLEEA